MSTEILSDFNVSGQRSAIVSRGKQYADLDLSLIPHPNKKDIIPLTDVDAVRNSVKNLVMTNRYERLFNPELSSGLKQLLFENSDSHTMYLIRTYIIEVIDTYEPRVSEVNVIVQDDSNNNGYNITIAFNVISVNTESDIQIFLERTR